MAVNGLTSLLQRWRTVSRGSVKMHSSLGSTTLVAERYRLSEFLQSVCNRPADSALKDTQGARRTSRPDQSFRCTGHRSPRVSVFKPSDTLGFSMPSRADVCLGFNGPVAGSVDQPQAGLGVNLGLVGGLAPSCTASRSGRAVTGDAISLRLIDSAPPGSAARLAGWCLERPASVR